MCVCVFVWIVVKGRVVNSRPFFLRVCVERRMDDQMLKYMRLVCSFLS